MDKPPLILRQSQNPSTEETRAVGHAAMLMDIPTRIVALDKLSVHDQALREGALPVGSVQFVREAMRVAGIPEPENLSYPESARDLLRRKVSLVTAHEVRSRVFVKPAQTKLFNGFVFDPDRAPQDYDEHDLEQFDVFVGLSPDTPVWVSEVVNFAGEWRCYVIENEILGMARYDPGEIEDVPAPDGEWLAQAVTRVRDDVSAAAFAIDVGRLQDGHCAIVEVNDAWATGRYPDALSPRAYLTWLWRRWSQLANPGLKPSSRFSST